MPIHKQPITLKSQPEAKKLLFIIPAGWTKITEMEPRTKKVPNLIAALTAAKNSDLLLVLAKLLLAGTKPCWI